MLYRPTNQSDSENLAKIFCRAEHAYFDHWSPQMKFPFGRRGEMHLQPLGDPEGPIFYLAEDFQSGEPLMDRPGRLAYKDQLQKLLPEVEQLDDRFGDDGCIGELAFAAKMCWQISTPYNMKIPYHDGWYYWATKASRMIRWLGHGLFKFSPERGITDFRLE